MHKQRVRERAARAADVAAARALFFGGGVPTLRVVEFAARVLVSILSRDVVPRGGEDLGEKVVVWVVMADSCCGAGPILAPTCL